jgi:hypothetical protein
MEVMLSKTYDALVAAGAPEEKARRGVEEIAASRVMRRRASYDDSGPLTTADLRIAVNELKVWLLLWMAAIAAASVVIVLATLNHA